MSAEDARKFGLVDEVITKRHPIEEKLQTVPAS
jgi:ATP-dependent protease ClpP protease subunit